MAVHETMNLRITELVQKHECWRRGCINLIASENVQSPAVRAQLAGDLTGRYGDYTGRELDHRRYFGTRYVQELEHEVTALAERLYNATYSELRPISGHVAGAAVLMGLCGPGDVVLEIGADGGGHRMAAKLAEASLIDLDVRFFPFNPETWNVPIDEARELIEQCRPRLVILGSSSFLFPHPVHELARTIHNRDGGFLAFDASHVFGLIGGGHFQDPLREGADVVFGSTHKTLPGPQGGMILSNDPDVIAAISAAVYPALVTNHHLARMPALGLALLEVEQWGRAYAEATIQNARRLAAELARRGLLVIAETEGYTQSHTLLVSTGSYQGGAQAGSRLEEAHIIVTTARLPERMGGTGIRIGTQEVTRLGATPQAMADLAELVADVVTAQATPDEVVPRASAWLEECLGPCRFTWGTDA